MPSMLRHLLNCLAFQEGFHGCTTLLEQYPNQAISKPLVFLSSGYFSCSANQLQVSLLYAHQITCLLGYKLMSSYGSINWFYCFKYHLCYWFKNLTCMTQSFFPCFVNCLTVYLYYSPSLHLVPFVFLQAVQLNIKPTVLVQKR